MSRLRIYVIEKYSFSSCACCGNSLQPWELNACNMTDKFLDAYEAALEKVYLSRIARFSEILVVDGSTTDVYDDDDVQIVSEAVLFFLAVFRHVNGVLPPSRVSCLIIFLYGSSLNVRD